MQSGVIKSVIKNLAVMYGAATIASVFAILVPHWDLETIGAGLLIPLFALPAIVCYVLLVHGGYKKSTCGFVYWILLLPLPLYWLYFSFFPSPGARGDGAEHMAFIMAVCILAAGVAAYLADRLWRKNTSRS